MRNPGSTIKTPFGSLSCGYNKKLALVWATERGPFIIVICTIYWNLKSIEVFFFVKPNQSPSWELIYKMSYTVHGPTRRTILKFIRNQYSAFVRLSVVIDFIFVFFDTHTAEQRLELKWRFGNDDDPDPPKFSIRV